MNKSAVPFGQTNAFSKIYVDYIENKPELRPFYKYPPSLSSFGQAIADKEKETIDRTLLADVLQKQYASIGIETAALNLSLLEQKNTFTVCTGHQLCLFTGPLYFIYKIITTINLAEELKRNYPEYNFLPVYWMASEDHDFEEINHIHIQGKKITWQAELATKGKQIPAGKINTDSLKEIIKEVKLLLGEGSSADSLIQLFETAYLKHSNLADATRFLVHYLFGKYGLIIVDANDARLKKQFAQIIKDDLLNHTNFKIVNSTIQKLRNLQLEAQVNPREINCFYFIDGERKRIVKSGAAVDPSSEIELSAALLEELDTHPEKFSPNVVLRPVYQQKILPNLAYVGGPGELAYWMEYKEMFEHHKINFPVLVPRNFVLFVDTKSNQQWTKLGLSPADYFRDVELLIKEYILKHGSSDLSLRNEQAELEKIFSEVSAKAERIDQTLKASVSAELQKTSNGFKTIEGKLLKAEKLKNETVVNQLRKIKSKLFPEAELQERYDNFIPYFLRNGDGFIDLLKKELNPLDFRFAVLTD